MGIPDNYDLWMAHDIEQEEWLHRLPQCENCGEYIQDDYYYEINGDYYCEDCLTNHFRKENYLGDDL